MALHFEAASPNEYIFEACLEDMKKTGIFRRFFGDYTWLGSNPGHRAMSGDKNILGVMVGRYVAVQRCVGKVSVRGLTDPDKELELALFENLHGPCEQVMRTTRHVMVRHKINRRKLWKCIAPTQD